MRKGNVIELAADNGLTPADETLAFWGSGIVGDRGALRALLIDMHRRGLPIVELAREVEALSAIAVGLRRGRRGRERETRRP